MQSPCIEYLSEVWCALVTEYLLDEENPISTGFPLDTGCRLDHECPVDHAVRCVMNIQ